MLKSDGGEFICADWGASTNRLMRAMFYGVQLLDGFETTHDNVSGKIPVLIKDAGFKTVTEITYFNTMFGTIRLYRAAK